MLKSLYIKNYTLIKETRFEPNAGLNIITGETGAGKTILLDALGLTLGERAEPKNVIENKAIVEAEYKIENLNLKRFFEENDLDYAESLVIRREITADGKSRAFVNDSLTNLAVLKELGTKLIEIHTQNSALDVRNTANKLAIVDDYSQNRPLFTEYEQSYKKLKQLQTLQLQLQDKISQATKDKDYNEFLIQEFDEVNLNSETDTSLELQLNELEHAEEIKNSAMQAAYALHINERSISAQLHDIKNVLKNAVNHSPILQQLYIQLSQLEIDAKELANDLETLAEKTESNSELLNKLNERYTKIQNLLRKHNAQNIDQLLDIYNQLSEQSFENSQLQIQLTQVSEQISDEIKTCTQLAEKLHKTRSSAATELSSKTVTELKLLEIKEAKFDIKIEFDPANLSANGADKIQFWFSANKGKEMGLLEKSASGGELSRVHFALKGLLADKAQLPTLIFDEADTGVSGEVAHRMGMLMNQMGQKHQIIAITHLPQVASKGKTHFFVHKSTLQNSSFSQIKLLNNAERVATIAEMIQGKNPNKAAMQAAQDLLQAH